jgi:hypothetical protein
MRKQGIRRAALVVSLDNPTRRGVAVTGPARQGGQGRASAPVHRARAAPGASGYGGGNGSDGSNGGDGGNGSAGGSVHAWIRLEPGAKPLLQIKLDDGYDQPFYIVDPNGRTLKIRADGRAGGRGGRGGKGGRGGQGGSGSHPDRMAWTVTLGWTDVREAVARDDYSARRPRRAVPAHDMNGRA